MYRYLLTIKKNKSKTCKLWRFLGFPRYCWASTGARVTFCPAAVTNENQIDPSCLDLFRKSPTKQKTPLSWETKPKSSRPLLKPSLQLTYIPHNSLKWLHGLDYLTKQFKSAKSKLFLKRKLNFIHSLLSQYTSTLK